MTIVFHSMQSLHRLPNYIIFSVHFQITVKGEVIICIICSCWLRCWFGMIKCIIFCAKMYVYIYMWQLIGYRELMYYIGNWYIANYLMCNGILYLVLKMNFDKGLHVKVKHSTISTKHSINISSAFPSLFVELNWRNWIKDLWALGCFTTSKKSREMEDMCIISLNSTK